MVKKEVNEEEIKKNIANILNDKFEETAEASIGENRGQKFIRIPKNIAKRMNLQSGQTMVFNVKNEAGKVKVEISVK